MEMIKPLSPRKTRSTTVNKIERMRGYFLFIEKSV
jgi:hypothetical protein